MHGWGESQFWWGKGTLSSVTGLSGLKLVWKPWPPLLILSTSWFICITFSSTFWAFGGIWIFLLAWCGKLTKELFLDSSCHALEGLKAFAPNGLSLPKPLPLRGGRTTKFGDWSYMVIALPTSCLGDKDLILSFMSSFSLGLFRLSGILNRYSRYRGLYVCFGDVETFLWGF